MYDTVNFCLSVMDVPNVVFLEETPCYLDSSTIACHNFSDKQVITGNLNGLKVSVGSNQVAIKDGSLCKWFLGDNYQTMSRKDTQEAIERLSDTLHLPINKAVVTRMDVAKNIIVDYPTDEYFDHLGELKYFKRLKEPTGLYYAKKEGRLCFYDKNAEQKAKGGTIPELYKGRNVLRYEQRYLKRLHRQLKRETVTGATLYDETFYIDVLNRWKFAYDSISKVNDQAFNFPKMKNKRQFYRMGVLSMVERAGGELPMINQINAAQKRGELTAKQAFDLRKEVKEACKTETGFTVKNAAISELDKKILEAVKYYR